MCFPPLKVGEVIPFYFLLGTKIECQNKLLGTSDFENYFFYHKHCCPHPSKKPKLPIESKNASLNAPLSHLFLSQILRLCKKKVCLCNLRRCTPECFFNQIYAKGPFPSLSSLLKILSQLTLSKLSKYFNSQTLSTHKLSNSFNSFPSFYH